MADESKMVKVQGEQAQALLDGMTAHEERLVGGLQEALAPYLPADGKHAVKWVFQATRNWLDKETQKLRQADTTHIRELSQDEQRRLERDETFMSVLDDFKSLQNALAASYGDGILSRLGLAGLQPATPEALLARLSKTLEIQDKQQADGETLPVPKKRRQRWTLGEIIAECKELHNTMKTSIDALTRDLHETKGALTDKYKRMESHATAHSAARGFASICAEASGEKALFDRFNVFPQRTAQRNRTTEDEPAPTENPTPTPNEPSE